MYQRQRADCTICRLGARLRGCGQPCEMGSRRTVRRGSKQTDKARGAQRMGLTPRGGFPSEARPELMANILSFKLAGCVECAVKTHKRRMHLIRMHLLLVKAGNGETGSK